MLDETPSLPGTFRHQFALDNYDTRAIAMTPGVEVASEKASSRDPLTRIEDKLNEAIRSVTTLSQRIDSIDIVLAKLASL